MDYQKMTVAQLKAEAEGRGIEVMKGWKKADIVAALEDAPQEVQAEVIDSQEGDLAVSALPGTIHANFDALEAKVDSIIAQYDGWEPSADNSDDVEQCIRERKYLNGLWKDIDERRKSVKREFMKPLDEFEARANGIRDKIKKTVERIQAVEKQADENRKTAKEAELRDHYAEYAEFLVPVVPYERIADPKWMNKQPTVEKCKEELEAKVGKIANDWETLKAMQLGEFLEQAELRFFQSLDLGDAISWANKLAEDKRRIDAMKQEIGEYHGEPEPEYELEKEPEPEPECAPQPVSQQAEPLRPQPIQPIPVQRAPYAEPEKPSSQQVLAEAMALAAKPSQQPARPCVMVIDSATVEQMQAIGKLCGLLGVTGAFKHGTLEEAYQRKHGKAVRYGI